MKRGGGGYKSRKAAPGGTVRGRRRGAPKPVKKTGKNEVIFFVSKKIEQKKKNTR